MSRAVQYIHHLKENEARNIEKWTLEKLLMDQAMGDLQAQLEEMRRLWEDERAARVKLEGEVKTLRSSQGTGSPAGSHGSGEDRPSPKRSHEETGKGTPSDDPEDRTKRQRVD